MILITPYELEIVFSPNIAILRTYMLKKVDFYEIYLLFICNPSAGLHVGICLELHQALSVFVFCMPALYLVYLHTILLKHF